MTRMVTIDNAAPERRSPRLIEVDAFQFEFVSALAKRESWRKEIYRPIYHVHKWWAKRLGSTFRGIILGCLIPESADLKDTFFEKRDPSNVTVFDPFMGSGTTIGEAHKLGCAALGRDINPVACESTRVAFGPLDRQRLHGAFSRLSATVGQRILELYRTTDENGQSSNVLYYFWVKHVPCPNCASGVDLFSTRIVGRNAYPNRKPEVQVCCPDCGGIFSALNGERSVRCYSCELVFDPYSGSTSRTCATCPVCSLSFPIAETVRTSDRPPGHRLYGKLLLTPEGEKRYLPTTLEDEQNYQACSRLLRRESKRGAIHLPNSVLADGFNTRQAIGYNYRTWRDFFNERQLLALGWLQEEIAALLHEPTREALLTLFSGVLEFNNLFASYKGEGTGAVRHMFSHHILKPERTPIEANVWGTAKSSGSFSTLFKTRLLRALDYRNAPFEAADVGSGKVYLSSSPFSGFVHRFWPTQGNFEPRGIYISCGSSDRTGLPNNCVDFVVTDPPFFDNVHYSELADFFYSWQSLYPRGFIGRSTTTRHEREVQDVDAERFATKLHAVFAECHRVLKNEGLLVFTYHHSRMEGWEALIRDIFGAGFSVVNAHPVKAEMSVATPKSQAKEPIQLDVILVCKKREQDTRIILKPFQALNEAAKRTDHKLKRLAPLGLNLSRNDHRITVISQFIAALGPVASAEIAVRTLRDQETKLIEVAESLPLIADTKSDPVGAEESSQSQQMTFLFE